MLSWLPGPCVVSVQGAPWSLGVSCCTSGATGVWTSSFGSRPTACGASSSQAGQGTGSTTARSTAWWAGRAGHRSTGALVWWACRHACLSCQLVNTLGACPTCGHMTAVQVRLHRPVGSTEADIMWADMQGSLRLLWNMLLVIHCCAACCFLCCCLPGTWTVMW